MKKVIYLLTLTLLASCNSETTTDSPEQINEVIQEEVIDRCVEFTPETAKNVSNEMDSTLYTEVEMVLIGEYLFTYMMVFPQDEMKENPFAQAISENAKKDGFEEYSNTCDVLEYKRRLLKEQGITEEDFAAGLKDDFEKLNEGLEEVSDQFESR